MGRDKALLELGGQSLLERTLDVLTTLCDELIVVADEARRYARLARVVPDVFTGSGTLGGVHAGLAAMKNDWGIVVACDMPFLDVRVLGYMAGLAPGYDVVVPFVAGNYEPLHAVYSKRCVEPIAALLAQGPQRIICFYDQVRVRRVEEGEVRRFDPTLRTWINVNTPEEWRRLTGRREG